MAASYENKVLSCVHVTPFQTNELNDILGVTINNRPTTQSIVKYISRFIFTLPPHLQTCQHYCGHSEASSCEETAVDVNTDSDGDFILSRKSCSTNANDEAGISNHHRFRFNSYRESSEIHDAEEDIVSSLCPYDRKTNKTEETRLMVDSYKCQTADLIGSLCRQESDDLRRVNTEEHVQEILTVEHSMETVLDDVGFQVWSGALLMCDYLLHNSQTLSDAVVLDLGSGTGITSIIAAMVSQRVICTDYSVAIVQLAERNWARNHDLLPVARLQSIDFKVLDWTKDMSPIAGGDEQRKYQLALQDFEDLKTVTVILAAEVIYDDALTDAFFKTVYHLLAEPPAKIVLITLEKRTVFRAESQDICSPAYEHFLENLEDLATVDKGPVRFNVEQLSNAIPTYFQYTQGIGAVENLNQLPLTLSARTLKMHGFYSQRGGPFAGTHS